MKPPKIILCYPEVRKRGNWNSTRAPRRTFVLPLSLLHLSVFLKKQGWNIQILDCRFHDYRTVDYTDVLFVGLSTLTGIQILNGLEIAQFIRKINPKIPLVWGGPHPSIMPDQTLRNDFVDVVVKGEGDKVIVELANAFSGQRQFESILGIGYKKDGNVFINPDRPFMDMDEIDELPYNMFDKEVYDLSQRLPYHSSRGCPHACTFCHNRALNKRSWRRQSAERILENLQELINQYQPSYIDFYEDEFFISQERVATICEGFINRKFNIQWYATGRMDQFSRYDDKFLDLLKKSGCYRLALGAESGSERILQAIAKKITFDDMFKTVEKCKKFDITPVISFMMAFPGETPEDRKQTVNVIKKLKQINPVAEINGVFLYTPYPGTQMFEEAVEQGYRPPASLEQWGTMIFSQNRKNYPWLNWTEYLEVSTVFNTSQVLSKHHKIQFKDSKNVSSVIINCIKFGKFWLKRVYLSLAKLRWKYNYFSLPIEYVVLEFHRKLRKTRVT